MVEAAVEAAAVEAAAVMEAGVLVEVAVVDVAAAMATVQVMARAAGLLRWAVADQAAAVVAGSMGAGST